MNKKEIEHIFLIVVAVIAIAFLINIMGAKYTGFYSLQDSILFNNNSNYVSDNINFSDSEIKLVSYTQIENITTENNTEYFIGKAKYYNEDVTQLIRYYDNNYIKINNILEFELENKKFINNQILSIYLNGEESDLTLCKAPGLCKDNNTNIMQNIHFTDPAFYNITINNLADEKKKLYLEGNISIDYIYMIERNITEKPIEKIYFKEQGNIETENINALGDFNYFDANSELNNQTIEFYYLENGTWNFLIVGNITFNPERLMIILKSDRSNTPILKDFVLSYAIPCKENWSCNNWSECINETKTRICADINECGTELEKPDEIEVCNETAEIPQNETNSTIPPIPPAGGGGGGGGGTRTTPEETRTLEKPVGKVQEVKKEETTRLLEKEIDRCNNGIQDPDEKGIDCGGNCPECKSILTILPYSNLMLFVLLLMMVMTLIDKGREWFKNDDEGTNN